MSKLTDEHIEAVKAAGLSTLVDALSKTKHHYAISMVELERFAQIIRNQALEEAAKVCENMQQGWASDDQLKCAAAIRALKGAKE